MNRLHEALEKSRKEAGFGAVWVAGVDERAEPGMYSVEQLTDPTASPVSLSRARLRENRVIAGYHAGPALDAYRILREQLLARMRANRWTTLAITSPGPGEGKSLTAANLAVSLAMEPEQWALLVDCDLRAPRLHTVFGIATRPGLGDHLARDMALAQMLLPIGINRLLLLPGGTAQPNSAELLASRKMRRLVRTLKSRENGRYVVFDLPPVLHCADMLAFAPLVDATLLVVEEGKTLREDAVRAAEYLSGYNLIGTVLNKCGEVRAQPLRERRHEPIGVPMAVRGHGT
jgi:protein-tyrosine kinase